MAELFYYTFLYLAFRYCLLVVIKRSPTHSIAIYIPGSVHMRQRNKVAKMLIVLILFCSYISMFACSSNINDTGSINDTGNEISSSTVAATIPADFQYAFEGSSHISLEKQPRSRTILDDFLEPALWKCSENSTLDSGAISVSSAGDIAEAYRKYDILLSLGTYLLLNVEAAGLKNLEWASLYLMEDLSYSNYYECDLMPYLSDGSNLFALNKSGFSIGSGEPGWDKINIIKIAFSTFGNSTSTITLHEISTYNARPVCSIWFDDGWESVYSEAFPIMAAKGFKGILSVIGSHVGYTVYCSAVQLDELYDCGWDLVNHTNDHPDLTSIALEVAETDIYRGYDYLYSRGYTRACANMVPPYCATNEAVNQAISKYAVTSRVTPGQYNYLPIQDPYNIGFKEVTSAISPDTVRQWIEHAIKNDLWLVLVFHSLDAPTDSSTKYVVPNFKKIVECLHQKRSEIDVVTLSELLDTDQIGRAHV